MASTAAVLNILVNAQTGKAQAELTALDAKLKKTAGTASGATAAMAPSGKMGKALAAGALGFAAVGVAAAAGAAELFKVGEQLDDAYDKIRSGTGKTGKQLEGLKKDFRSVAQQVPNDFAETGTAIADLNKRLGLAGKPLRSMARNMLDLSRITETDLEGNIKSVARSFTDWEVPVKNQTRTLDGLFRLSQRSGASVADIADNMQKFGSPLRTLGYNVGEAAAMFANFERAGVNMQTMVPGLKLAIGNLSQPTDDLRSKLEKLHVATDDPKKGLQRIMALLSNESSLSRIDKMNLAMDVFGKRAGADMAEAVKQGRFNVGSFIQTFNKGRDTIRKTADDTNDTAENMGIFWNKVKIAVAPAADAVFNAVGKFSRVLADLPINRVNADVKRFFRSNQDLKDVLKVVGVALRVFGRAASEVWKVVKEQFRGMLQYIKGGFQVIRGIVRIVSRALRGDWKGAWDAVKETTRGAITMVLGVLRATTAPVRAIVGKIGGALKGTFSGAWSAVKGIFTSGANAVIDIMNAVIRVINKIPGIPDIGEVGKLGGPNIGKDTNGKSLGRQSGGIVPGVGEGDKWHKMLPAGSFVLNKKATEAYGLGRQSGGMVPTILEPGERYFMPGEVKKIGLGKLTAMNETVSRFQQGGPVGLIGGGIADFASGIAGAAKSGIEGVGSKILSKGAGFLLAQLPKPNIPEPFTGVGPFVIDHVTDFIKDAVGIYKKNAVDPGVGSFDGKKVAGWIIPILQWARTAGWSGSVTSGFRSYAEQAALYANRGSNPNPVAPPGSSNHEGSAYPKGAVDVSDYLGLNGLVDDPRGPFPGKLKWFGMGDPVHFSGTGHMLGGLVGALAQMMAKGGQVAKRGKGIWAGTSIDKTYPVSDGYSGEKLKPYIIKAIAESFGLPGVTMEQITQGESMGRPGVDISDPPGRSRGLYAVNDHYNPQFSSTQLRNPIYATWAAKQLADAAGGPNSNIWHGDKYVTGWNQHYDASNEKLRNIARSLGGSGDGEDPSPEESARAATKSRKKSRDEQLATLLKKAGGMDTALGKKGVYWQVLDLFAKYGDFDFRKAGIANGGVTPEVNQAAEFIERARKVASIANPNQGAGQLYSLVGWLRDRVELTGNEKENGGLSSKLAAAHKAGGDVSKSRRQKIYERMKGLAHTLVYTKPLERNESAIAKLEERIGLAVQEHSGEWSEMGSEMSQGEIDTEKGLNTGLWRLLSNRKAMLNNYIPFAEDKESQLLKQIAAWSANPKLKWKVPGLRMALKATRDSLPSMRQGLVDLVGLTGDGGSLAQVNFRLKELGVMSPENGTDTSVLSISDVLDIVQAAKYGVYDRLPSFHSGGTVKGSGHEEVMALVQARESIYTPRDNDRVAGALAAGPGDIRVIVNGDIVSEHPDPVEVVVGDRRFRAQVQKQIRGHESASTRLLARGVRP